ncbi:MAG TPA: hypothetical protein VHW01_23015 [Polyangiaceae bacterium]|nr:hypothetical protein [Polyangiaceae bacterium]
MTCAGSQRLPVFRGLALLGLGAVWAAACGGPQKQAGAGAVCFRTDDCQTELACVPEAIGSSTRVCSADASGIVSMVDGAPFEAAAPMPDAAAGGSFAGSTATPGGGSNAAGATSLPKGGSGGAGAAGAPTSGGGGAGTAGASAKGGSGGTGTSGAPAMGGSGGAIAGSAGATAGSGGAAAGSGGATAGSGG